MNSKKVPQLFVATGATKWNDPRTIPGPWLAAELPERIPHLCEIYPEEN